MRLLPLLLLAACGYTFDRDRSQAPLEGGSLPKVAVLPFDNLTFRRGLEVQLTRLVADEIRARSPRAAYGPEDADWLLTGTIVRADVRVLSEDDQDRVREASFVVLVKGTIQKRSSEDEVLTYSIEEREPYSDRAGRLRTLEQAQVAALRDVAERIVYQLESRQPKETS
jgi:hypothetical protein